MTSITGAAPCQDPQSGAVSPKTPCDGLGFLGSTLHNPNWISRARHILPPTRSIVVGASRMFASVIGFESSSSSSSSSDATRDNNDDQDVSSQGVHAIEDREPHFFAGKDETKCLIEQLLTQESFSRQEYDKLTDIIKSRVVDSPSIGGLGLGRLNETPERTDVEIQDFCNRAVIGATKLEEKSGSNSKSGSPLDMDKSSMQTRPPWASHSKKNIQYRSPSSIAMPLFKGKTPYSIGGNFLYSSKRKRGSPATGSWNIHDEIRKVRSKATEETLRTPSSSKVDRSSFPLEAKNGPDSVLAGNLGPAKENKSRSSKRPVGASRDLAAKPVSQLTQDAFHNDALPRSATFGCEQNQDNQTIQSIEGEKDETLDVEQRLQSTVVVKTAAHRWQSRWPFYCNLESISCHSNVVAPDPNHLKELDGCILPCSSTKEGTVQDSQVEDKKFWTLNEVAGIVNANSFPSGSNTSSKVDREQNHRPIISKEDEAVGSGHDNAVRVVKEEKCELLCETSTEVPMVNETNAAAASGSQQHQSTPTSKDSLAGNSNSGLETQQKGNELIRYNTRNRGRRR